MDISIIGDVSLKEDYDVNQVELNQYIKDRLDKLSKLTVEDINLILNMEMEYYRAKALLIKKEI